MLGGPAARSCCARRAAQAQTPLDTYLADLKTLRAEFSQAVTDGKGGEVQKRAGTLAIVRPGQIPLGTDTAAPRAAASPQLMVADGKNLWFYDRDLEQVSVKPAAAALTATPAGLLSGEGNAARIVHGRAGRQNETGSTGCWWCRKQATRTSAKRSWASDNGSELRRMVLKDKLGQTVRLDFRTASAIAPVAEAEVKFTPPAGADVIGTPVPDTMKLR